jgi:GDP-L-fucose synthase
MIEWATTRVCVTGGGGFLGSFVVDELRRRGARELFVPRRRDYDLRDRAAIDRCLADARPEVILHLAAVVGGIGANWRHPGSFLYDNLMMGTQLIEAARHQGVTKFVAIGTVCAYPKVTPIPFREERLWDGYPEETNAPYGLAKKLMLVQLQGYRAEYGFPGIFLLPVNLYGPRDNFDLERGHVIPAMIRKMSEARDRGAGEVVLWGDGTPTREFLYVEDCARGIVQAAERYDAPDPVNLGSGQEITMRDLAALIAREVGFTGAIRWDPTQPNGQPRRCLDTSRARERFGWAATVALAEGVGRTVGWWAANRVNGL